MSKQRPALVMADQEFDGLHEAVDKVRSASTTVKVDVKALRHLLQDYASLLTILRINPQE